MQKDFKIRTWIKAVINKRQNLCKIASNLNIHRKRNFLSIIGIYFEILPYVRHKNIKTIFKLLRNQKSYPIKFQLLKHLKSSFLKLTQSHFCTRNNCSMLNYDLKNTMFQSSKINVVRHV